MSVHYLTLNFCFSFLSLRDLLVSPVENSAMHQFSVFLFIISAASGLSCSTQGLPCDIRDLSFWCVGSRELLGSLVVAHRLSCPTACGILVL